MTAASRLPRRARWRAAVTSKSSASEPSGGTSSGNDGGGSNGGGGPPPPPSPPGGQEVIQNLEVLVGDLLCLVCFALYKQVGGWVGAEVAGSQGLKPRAEARLSQELLPR